MASSQRQSCGLVSARGVQTRSTGPRFTRNLKPKYEIFRHHRVFCQFSVNSRPPRPPMPCHRKREAHADRFPLKMLVPSSLQVSCGQPHTVLAKLKIRRQKQFLRICDPQNDPLQSHVENSVPGFRSRSLDCQNILPMRSGNHSGFLSVFWQLDFETTDGTSSVCRTKPTLKLRVPRPFPPLCFRRSGFNIEGGRRFGGPGLQQPHRAASIRKARNKKCSELPGSAITLR